MKHKLTWGNVIALCALTGVTCVLITYLATMQVFTGMLPGYEKNQKMIDKIGRISDIVSEKYVGDYEEEKLVDWTAYALMTGLGDPYSTYLPAASTETYLDNKHGSTTGVGVYYEWNETEGGCEIYAAMPGSSAEEAGLGKGDLLLAADGVAGKTAGEEALLAAVKGETGTFVNATIRKASGETVTLDLERRETAQLMAAGRMLDDKTGYIQIYNFHEGVKDQFDAAYKTLKSRGMDKLVLDVRRNPGGLIEEMSEIADLFLPECDVMITRKKDGAEYRYSSDKKQDEIDLAVLVDEYSYSSAEFFAAVLQEYGRAVTVGAKTTGKGRAQNVYQLGDGSAIVLSDQAYFTPGGRNLGDTGMTPDIEIALTEAQNERFRFLADEDDPRLTAAREALLG